MRHVGGIANAVAVLLTYDKISFLQLIEFVLQGARTNAGLAGKLAQIGGALGLIEKMRQDGSARFTEEDRSSGIHFDLVYGTFILDYRTKVQ